MKLIIYTLHGCKTCKVRQQFHNEIADNLQENGIDTMGIMYGMINNERYEPLSEHDSLCRKPDNPMAYFAPVYILETDKATVKLEDPSKFKDSGDYSNYILNMCDDIESKTSAME